MSEEFNGKVEDRKGTLVLSVLSRTAREKFPSLVALLNAKKVDVVEVKNRDRVVCLITPPPAERLKIGGFKIE